MAFTFNSGEEDFKRLLNSNYFVDKTDFIFNLNKKINAKGNLICISRPKKFGKTSIIDMLTAYYSYSEQKTTIFNDKNISKRYINQVETRTKNKPDENNLKYLNEYNVIKLEMNEYFSRYNNFNVEEGIKRIKRAIVNSVKMKIKNFSFSDEFDISEIINDIFEETRRKIIF
ncbi:hypothetical protein BCR36DRAFT_306962 [Piromyces finnis]|uniref:AAA-ATPase-like domain-containing protein n=1 Tax=Piromyces finnis TaxID=1754191 RepID=A0A1Y1UWP1_9FUNG|nr:hypothetical protein BCR36DRAFT_306962 [Piromyces finnis]|eukprot:ORX42503.1 hypothetical protein BCR36DRAFT_306962 [Piromyces finnis]